MCRTTPKDVASEGLKHFDLELRLAFERVTGTRVCDNAGDQGPLPAPRAGVGLCSCALAADAAYEASRAATHTLCVKVRPVTSRQLSVLSDDKSPWSV